MIRRMSKIPTILKMVCLSCKRRMIFIKVDVSLTQLKSTFFIFFLGFKMEQHLACLSIIFTFVA